MPVHKYVEGRRVRKASATTAVSERASERQGGRERQRMVDVHHLGAEKSGATRPGQRRVSGYATIWSAKLVAAEWCGG